jgi:hypothetical protein
MATVAGASASRRHYPAEAEAFFAACAGYFSALSSNSEELALTRLMRAWIESSKGASQACAALVPMLENAANSLTRSWDELSVAYAKADLALRR